MNENDQIVKTEGPAEACPNCEGTEFALGRKEQRFLYGKENEAIELRAIVPVYACKACGFEFTGEDAEEARHEAVCRYLRVMTPCEVGAVRKKHEMTRAEFAQLSRIGTASLARWEAGILVQNGANDQLLYLLQFEENVALLNHREALRISSSHESGEAPERVGVLVQGCDGSRRRRLRRCPVRGSFRLLEEPEQRRATAAGWRP